MRHYYKRNVKDLKEGLLPNVRLCVHTTSSNCVSQQCHHQLPLLLLQSLCAGERDDMMTTSAAAAAAAAIPVPRMRN